MASLFHPTVRRQTGVRILLHAAFWVAVVFYFAWGFGLNNNARTSVANSLFFLPGHMLMMYSLLYFLTPRYLVKKKYVQFFAGLLVVVALCAGYAWLANVTLLTNATFSGFRLNTGRNILPFIHVAGIAFSIKFLNYWHRQKQETVEAQREALRAELELLKSQVHPHFLFNTLNNLYAHTLERSDKAPEIVLRLSSLLRFMIYESKAGRIALAKEVLVLQAYVDLERLRYGNRLDVSFACHGDTEGRFIAPLLLLPFLENAFKHGTSRQLDQCWISLDLRVDGGALDFKLVNSVDGEEAAADASAGGLGLQNVKRRLELLYPGRYNLTLQQEEEVFIVTLRLQLDAAKEDAGLTPSRTVLIGERYGLEMPDSR